MRTKQVQKDISDIYGYDRQINNIYSNIEKDLSQKTIQLIKKYDIVMINESRAKSTRRKQLQTIYLLSKMIHKEWDEVTKDDIEVLVAEIMTKYAEPNGQESHYSYDYKKILKIFFRWLKLGSREQKEVGDPEETKKIKLGKIRDKIVREDLITDEDITKLLKACSGNVRNRALIDVQAEAGIRPGELLSLQIKHVKFDKYGAMIHVDGKTGARPVRLIRSVPNLASWLDVHPLKNDTESPLWINLGKRNYGEKLGAGATRQVLKFACEKAGITKRVHLNLFRHSEATNSAKYLTEAQLKKRHGWSSVSRMPSRYVHLVDSDVDEAILKQHGIIMNDENEKEMPKMCHICSMPNSPESELCNKCGKPLDIKKAIELEEKSNQQNFMTNKLAGKVLVQMLMTGEIPKLPKKEVQHLIQELNL